MEETETSRECKQNVKGGGVKMRFFFCLVDEEHSQFRRCQQPGTPILHCRQVEGGDNRRVLQSSMLCSLRYLFFLFMFSFHRETRKKREGFS